VSDVDVAAIRADHELATAYLPDGTQAEHIAVGAAHELLIHTHVPALLDALATRDARIAELEAALVDAGRGAALAARDHRRRADIERLTNERDQARARVADLEAEVAATKASASTRWCLIPDCFEALDVTVGAKGWLLATALGGYVCPEHAALATAHQPQWQHYVGNRSTLRCACGWDSVPVGHRRAGTELWLDHAHDVTAAPPADGPGPHATENGPGRAPDATEPPPETGATRDAL
jgi:hypothetical protein